MKTWTFYRCPGFWPNLNTFVGYGAAGVGQFLGEHSRLLVKFNLPSRPNGTLIDRAYLVAAPNGHSRLDVLAWGDNVLAYELLDDAWVTATDGSHHAAATPLDGGAKVMIYNNVGTPKTTSTVWDITNLMENWDANPATNHGIMLRTETEFVTNQGGFFFEEDMWQQSDYDAFAASTPNNLVTDLNDRGGVRLIVFFTRMALAENQLYKSDENPLANDGLPVSGDPYLGTEHQFYVGNLPSRWQALYVRGRGVSSGPNPPTFDNQGPYRLPLAGVFNLAVEDAAGTVFRPDASQAGTDFVLLDGRASPGSNYNVSLTGGEGAKGYALGRAGEATSLSTVGQTTVTDQVSFSTDQGLQLVNIQFPANSSSRVDVVIEKDNLVATGDEQFYIENAKKFRSALFEGGQVVQVRPSVKYLEPSDGLLREDSDYYYRLTTGGALDVSGNVNYALAITYNGPELKYYGCVDMYYEFCQKFETVMQTFAVRVRVTCSPWVPAAVGRHLCPGGLPGNHRSEQ